MIRNILTWCLVRGELRQAIWMLVFENLLFRGNASPNVQAVQILRSKVLMGTTRQESLRYRKQRLLPRLLSNRSQNVRVASTCLSCPGVIFEFAAALQGLYLLTKEVYLWCRFMFTVFTSVFCLVISLYHFWK